MSYSQQTFSPLDYGFRWTDDGWYEFDCKTAEQAAKQARDARAAEYKKQGFRVRKSSLRNQLVSRGGIGSGRPHIELVISCYMLDVERP